MRGQPFHRVLVLAALALAVGVVVFHAVLKPAPDSQTIRQITNYMNTSEIWQGRYPPDFTLPQAKGESFHLADHVGREIVILNFFATWCHPCKREMPELEEYYVKHRKTPLILVGINADEEPDAVDAFRKELKLTFPIGIDTNGAIAEAYGVRSYPTTVLIGVDGRVQLFQIGSIANADVVFESLVSAQAALLKQGKVISSDEYETRRKNQPPLPGKKTASAKQDKPTPALSGPARAFADRMKCPSCGDSVNSCHCGLCDGVKERLATLNVTDKTDDAILHELFMEGKTP